MKIIKSKQADQLLGGKLEQEIMEVIWRIENATVRQVLDALQEKRDIAYTTVMTVMTRLADKGLLKRTLEKNGCYCYRTVHGKQKYSELASKRAISSLIKAFGEVAVAQFVDVVESSDSKNLEEWRQKLKAIT